GNERGRDVHITHRRMHGGAALEVAALGQEGIAYGPWTHAAVVARIAFQRTGGATGGGVIGAGHAEGVLRRTPRKGQDDVLAALGVVEVDELGRKRARLDAFDRRRAGPLPTLPRFGGRDAL